MYMVVDLIFRTIIIFYHHELLTFGDPYGRQCFLVEGILLSSLPFLFFPFWFLVWTIHLVPFALVLGPRPSRRFSTSMWLRPMKVCGGITVQSQPLSYLLQSLLILSSHLYLQGEGRKHGGIVNSFFFRELGKVLERLTRGERIEPNTMNYHVGIVIIFGSFLSQRCSHISIAQ